jgi:PQQ-dependent catabolism-associated CXXCW motif protein
MVRNGWSAMLFCISLVGAPTFGQIITPSIESSFDSEGYRASRYRAPVDRPPDPAQRMTLSKALRLQKYNRALFIDVAPVEGGYRDPSTGVWKLSQSHTTISGATWHPETGRTHPDPILWQGLLADVQKKSKHRPDVPIVLYCRSDCWMGWNAARRLALAGVRKVYWLAEGIDGWHDAGRTLDLVQPVTVSP